LRGMQQKKQVQPRGVGRTGTPAVPKKLEQANIGGHRTSKYLRMEDTWPLWGKKGGLSEQLAVLVGPEHGLTMLVRKKHSSGGNNKMPNWDSEMGARKEGGTVQSKQKKPVGGDRGTESGPN